LNTGFNLFLNWKGTKVDNFTYFNRFFNRVWDKKLTIVGLSNLFTLPFESLPPVVKAGSKQIIVTLLKLIHDSEVQKLEIAENLKKAEAKQEEEEDLDDEEDYELDEHEERDDGADLITRAKEAARVSCLAYLYNSHTSVL
jgi:hypothetical protein